MYILFSPQPIKFNSVFVKPGGKPGKNSMKPVKTFARQNLLNCEIEITQF